MTQEQLREAAENYALSEETLSPQPYDSDFSLHAVYLESFIAGATSQAAKEYWQEKAGEYNWRICPSCGGDGFTAEHDPTDPHINGFCNNCPIQVQCEHCEATGKLPSPPKIDNL